MSNITLNEQIASARKQVVSDGYEMSVGELVSLYKAQELIINPAFQRLFRWEQTQKTRFIESLILAIPIPPIFVFQRESGVWELIDGLQRVSTILQLFGILQRPDATLEDPLVLTGTSLLPALAEKRWEGTSDSDHNALDVSQQLAVKRARLRVEILKRESDEDAKFELFQRLNTGGSPLSEQEVRNCVLVMSNEHFFDWITKIADDSSFRVTTPFTETAKNQGKALELVIRFIAYRRVPYSYGLDVNEYLDSAARKLSKDDSTFWIEEDRIFRSTFRILNDCFGEAVFKRWDGTRHFGPFLISGFDAIAHGVAVNLDAIEAMQKDLQLEWVRERVRDVWESEIFKRNSGMGVRGTTRLMNLLPFGASHFRPE